MGQGTYYDDTSDVVNDVWFDILNDRELDEDYDDIRDYDKEVYKTSIRVLKRIKEHHITAGIALILAKKMSNFRGKTIPNKLPRGYPVALKRMAKNASEFMLDHFNNSLDWKNPQKRVDALEDMIDLFSSGTRKTSVRRKPIKRRSTKRRRTPKHKSKSTYKRKNYYIPPPPPIPYNNNRYVKKGVVACDIWQSKLICGQQPDCTWDDSQCKYKSQVPSWKRCNKGEVMNPKTGRCVSIAYAKQIGLLV